ncbi:MAG TPA: hypothetical protein DEF45_22110 [Rhodopirellula sp.]|nr:hypothetical protein [Rhodopirellula sp.]
MSRILRAAAKSSFTIGLNILGGQAPSGFYLAPMKLLICLGQAAQKSRYRQYCYPPADRVPSPITAKEQLFIGLLHGIRLTLFQ